MKKIIKKAGQFYSHVILQNIGLFIAYGLLTVIFEPNGWFPQKELKQAAEIIYQIILPVALAYTAGYKTGGRSGGLGAVLACTGILIDQMIPHIVGALLLAPMAGYLTNRLLEMGKERVLTGFEMLAENLIIGVSGGILAIFSYFAVTPLLTGLHQILYQVVNFLFQNHLIPFMSVLIEPAKVLFLNNTVNHGLLVPLGLEQVRSVGASILFLLETNPGPGLGVLLAFYILYQQKRKNYLASMVIQFAGGIHEIYFPYILANPRLIFAIILGGMAGSFCFAIMGAGLVGPASPGSFLTLFLMGPRQAWPGILTGVMVSGFISCLISVLILKQHTKKEIEKEEKKRKVKKQIKREETAMERNREMSFAQNEKIKKVYFVCDGGFGSSAMGAAVVRRKLKAAQVEGIQVANVAIEDLPVDGDVIFCQKELRKRIEKSGGKAAIYYVDDLVHAEEYDNWIQTLR